MTRIGANMKLIIARSQREKARAAFEALGAVIAEGPVAHLELYRIEGLQIGAFYVDEGEALSHLDARRGAWLEFAVADVDGMAKRLDALGLDRIDDADKDHPYLQIPGGPVFRLTPA